MAHNIVNVIDLVPGAVRALAAVDAIGLSEEQFWQEFVCTHTPVILKGAVSGWPALGRWSQPEYLRSRCADEVVQFARMFNPLPTGPYFNNAVQSAKLGACLAQMMDAPAGATFSIPAIAIPQQWQADLGKYDFLGAKFERRPRGYPGRRLFVYKNASTDWHYHPFDETITSQLAGSKHISLFRLTPENWDAYAAPIKANFHHMGCPEQIFPAHAQVAKYEGVLEAGDAVYIPPFWWHGIDPADTGIGVTLAHCFRSPLRRLGDWREPVTRELIGGALRPAGSVVPNLPFLLSIVGLVALSATARKLAKEQWWSA